MLVDHFYDDSGAEECGRFLAETNRLLIVADPPFGVMVSPLLKSLDRIAQRHTNLHNDASVECQKLIALPYFLEKQVVDYDPRIKMADFKVTCVVLLIEEVRISSSSSRSHTPIIPITPL